jgi:hypothetical protein
VFDNTADAWYLDAQDRHDRLVNQLIQNMYGHFQAERGGIADLEEAQPGANYYPAFLDEEMSENLPTHDRKFLEKFEARYRAVIDRISAARPAPKRLIIVNGGRSEPW